jgi:hypothetical protein
VSGIGGVETLVSAPLFVSSSSQYGGPRYNYSASSGGSSDMFADQAIKMPKHSDASAAVAAIAKDSSLNSESLL